MSTRIFGMLLTGLALAMAVLIIIEIVPPLGARSDTDVAAPGDAVNIDINKSIVPPVFRTIEEANSQLIMRGTSAPEAVLTLMKNRVRVNQTRSNGDGEWEVRTDALPNEIATFDMTLAPTTGGRIWSDETVIRATAAPKLGANPSAQGETLARPPKALIIVTAPGGPSRIVQNPFPSDPVDGPLSMGPIDYDDSGGVIFSGRSTIPGRVRIYGDGQAIGETQISSAGRWFFIAADTVPERTYKIAAELMTSTGVLSRVSVELTRLPRAVDTEIISDIPVVLVDDKSWQVRRTLIGGGAQYTAVFDPARANADPLTLE